MSLRSSVLVRQIYTPGYRCNVNDNSSYHITVATRSEKYPFVLTDMYISILAQRHG